MQQDSDVSYEKSFSYVIDGNDKQLFTVAFLTLRTIPKVTFPAIGKARSKRQRIFEWFATE
ncbi:hypothetical protein RMSM_05137 [Rhodopirellula maiorica SM1]|uniref:Uncharacterized protein n=1 Tax=Rhodopirellula maiorica SM1 TaxID=1265738 RepID=M5REZ2_9BACT|nr:hypothetical protein RMSM_05137 [Rhodopirellula maiorica SM1]